MRSSPKKLKREQASKSSRFTLARGPINMFSYASRFPSCLGVDNMRPYRGPQQISPLEELPCDNHVHVLDPAVGRFSMLNEFKYRK